MSFSSKAMQGRNGFLYLAGKDSNDLLNFLQDEKQIGSTALKVHEYNRQATEALTVPFAGIIVPEAHCVYPENLPSEVRVSENRPVRRAAEIIDPRYIYTLGILNDLKQNGIPAYTGRDSHWTYDAALASYLAIRDKIGKTNAYTSTYSPEDDVEVGDLQYADVNDVIVAEKAARREKRKHFDLTFASQLLNHGNTITVYNANGSGRCLAFGSSFSEKLIPAYASDFEELIFCYGTTVDPILVALLQPDCVLSEIPERFVHYPAISVKGASLMSLLIGLRANFDKVSPSLSEPGKYPDSATVGAQLFSNAFRYIENPARNTFVSQVDQVDNDAAAKLALLTEMPATVTGAPFMRLIFSGQFGSPDMLYSAAELVDRRELTAAYLPFLPESEAGLLTRIRILIRAGLTSRAKKEIDQLIELFGSSKSTDAYLNHLKTI